MDQSLKEKIEKRAYEIFMARGGAHGYAIDDWLQAEKEILAHQKAQTTKSNSQSSVTSTKKKKVVGR